MDNTQALFIIQKLADGINPHSGEIYPMDSAYQHPDTVRALQRAIPALERAVRSQKRRGNLPENAGKPWNPEEDKKLIAWYKAGKSIDDLAKLHKRTQGSITSRLLKNGIIES